MSAKERYKQWLSMKDLTPDMVEELKAMSEETIEEAFYDDLSFGTAGLRGILGLGTNRMNEFVIARATQGLAETIKKRGPEAMERGVAIAWDVRIKSEEFKNVAAKVLAANGIKVHVFDDIRPTPMLSYAVRNLKAQAGIVVTASHNPQAYNGYKVYWEDGAQIVDEIADEILHEIHSLPYDQIDRMDWDDAVAKGLINKIPDELDGAYYHEILKRAIHDDIDKDISVVYTPLNGTGNLPVRHVLRERGFRNIHVVKEQELPDGTFKTVGYPNPEDPKAFKLALRDARELEAELVIATDPDCDRVSIFSRLNSGDYVQFNGNQIGVLLIYYILNELKAMDKLPKNPAIVKSIVTGELSTLIANDLGVPMFNQLTGFKNICSLANLWDKTHEHTFLFGYEESIGYVYGDYVRDKDGVVTSMMIAEMAGFYLNQGKRLHDVLYEIYEKYGYYKEELYSINLEGVEGKGRMGRMMDYLRQDSPSDIGGERVVKMVDYLPGVEGIGSSNVLEFHLEDGSRFSIRPSGTEPKIKIYIYINSPSESETDRKLARLKEVVNDMILSVK